MHSVYCVVSVTKMAQVGLRSGREEFPDVEVAGDMSGARPLGGGCDARGRRTSAASAGGSSNPA